MKKLLALAIMLILVLSLVAFVGCDKSDKTEETEGGAANADTTNADTTLSDTVPADGTDDPEDPSIPDLVLSAENIESYTFVRKDETTTKDSVLFTQLADGVQAAVGYRPSLKSDFLYGGETPAELEILLGETNRAESAEVYAGLKYNDYVIERKGSKIVIAGGSNESQKQAIDFFVSLFKDGKATFSGNYRYEYNAEYELNDVTIAGVSLSEYKLVYASADNLVAVNVIRDGIGELCGIRIPYVKHTEDETEYEIVVGETKRNRDITCDYYCYQIMPSEKSFHINSYDVYALNAAAHTFVDIVKEKNGNLTAEDLTYIYEVPDREEYINDIDKLYMRWADYWQAPKGMLDYEGKLAAYINPGDRLMTVAHRADADYYPENSIESIISFYKMGGDVVEIDVGYTLDGVLILLHDQTLDRMTNVEEFAGKTIGGITFPNTSHVKYWTYEQLQYLNLVEGKGGKNAKLTPFKIPTLAEALKVCKNRLLVLPDKAQAANGGLWRYADVEGVQPNNQNYFLYDAMVEADNYESILLSYGYLTTTEAVTLQKWLYEETGVMPYIMLRENSNPKGAYKILKSQAMPNSFAIQINGSFHNENYPKNYADDYEELKGKCLMLGWTIVDETYEYAVDGKESWDQMYELGYRMIMTNKYLDLVKYAAEIYEGIE